MGHQVGKCLVAHLLELLMTILLHESFKESNRLHPIQHGGTMTLARRPDHRRPGSVRQLQFLIGFRDFYSSIEIFLLFGHFIKVQISHGGLGGIVHHDIPSLIIGGREILHRRSDRKAEADQVIRCFTTNGDHLVRIIRARVHLNVQSGTGNNGSDELGWVGGTGMLVVVTCPSVIGCLDAGFHPFNKVAPFE